jgi:hypothetical protein
MCWFDQAALSSSFWHRRVTVMAGEGGRSTPLFLWVEGVDADLRRHDGRGRSTGQRQRRLVLGLISFFEITFICFFRVLFLELYGNMIS